tara:strand:+ start:82 stop:210 length:129 start_codon:yes stop_codon:yes gene_type:complete
MSKIEDFAFAIAIILAAHYIYDNFMRGEMNGRQPYDWNLLEY